MQIMKRAVVYIKVCDFDDNDGQSSLLIFVEPFGQNKSYQVTNTKRSKTEKKKADHWFLPPSPTIFFAFYFILFFNFLFSYNCLHFLPIPPPYPSQSYLPPPLLPSPLILSLCPSRQGKQQMLKEEMG